MVLVQRAATPVVMVLIAMPLLTELVSSKHGSTIDMALPTELATGPPPLFHRKQPKTIRTCVSAAIPMSYAPHAIHTGYSPDTQARYNLDTSCGFLGASPASCTSHVRDRYETRTSLIENLLS